jgi:hypothetical protein
MFLGDPADVAVLKAGLARFQGGDEGRVERGCRLDGDVGHNAGVVATGMPDLDVIARDYADFLALGFLTLLYNRLSASRRRFLALWSVNDSRCSISGSRSRISSSS